MTLASKITLVRVLLIPAYMATMYLSGGQAGLWMYISLAIFAIASLTDYVDGYIARHYNQVTDFGKFVDPLADKLLVTAALIIFVGQGKMASWMVFVILAREFIITSLRNVAAAKGQVMAAAWSGKVKTCIQIAAIIVIFLDSSLLGGSILTPIAGWAATLITIYSGYDYLHRNWALVAEGATKPAQK